jgi:ubiquitin thioesterase ZRANB1
MLATLLSQIEGSGSGVKRVPSYVAPDLAADIRRHMASTVRQRKGYFPCHFVTELTTFALPAGRLLSNYFSSKSKLYKLE